MKAILSAAVLLLSFASPGFADEAAGTPTGAAPAVVEIVPTTTAPDATMPDATTGAAASSPAAEGEAQSTAATGGHGCASKNKTVYLTN